MVKIFFSEKVDLNFKNYVKETPFEEMMEWPYLDFKNYDEFDKHMEIRGPYWIGALIDLGNCNNKKSLESQWDSMSEVFKKYHANNFEWIKNPETCLKEISNQREEKLEEIINLFEKSQECHWKRLHDFYCYC